MLEPGDRCGEKKVLLKSYKLTGENKKLLRRRQEVELLRYCFILSLIAFLNFSIHSADSAFVGGVTS